MTANADESRLSSPAQDVASAAAGLQILNPMAEMEKSISSLRLSAKAVQELRQRWNGARDTDRARAIGTWATLTAWRTHVALDIPGKAKDKTVRTEEFVRYWQLKHSGSRISVASLYRWAAAYEEEGLPGLLPNYQTGPSDDDNIPEEVEEYGKRAAAYYLTENRRALTECIERATIDIAAERPDLVGRCPSEATIRRYIHRHYSSQAIILHREGPEAFRRKAWPFVERDRTSVAVMQIWSADHAELDLWCNNLDGKLIRPWVTDFRDVRSNKRMGWVVHTGPSGDTVLAAFANGVTRYGVPQAVVMDNGREFTSKVFAGKSRRWTGKHRNFKVKIDEPRVKALLSHLGTEAIITEPGNPHGKAAHERGYGIDHTEFDKWWKTYSGKDPKERPSHLRYIKRKRNSCPSLAEVQLAFGDHVFAHDAEESDAQGLDGQSPDQVFAAGVYEKRIVPETDLYFLMMKTTKPRKVGPNGLWLFDRYYQSTLLQEHLGKNVYARYTLDDISQVHAFDLEDRYIDTLERLDLVPYRPTADDVRQAEKYKKNARRLASLNAETRALRAQEPDPILYFAQKRQAVAAAAPAGAQNTVTVNMPFGAAANQAKARAEEREARKASAKLAKTAADKQRRLRGVKPHAPEVDVKELARQAAAKFAVLHPHQERG